MNSKDFMKISLKKITLAPAKQGCDLGDGSERAEYVNQDYILNKLGRPHRNVNIMYTYYPHDKQWPQRISLACKDMKINYQWDYPYDDYPCYGQNGEPFNQMRDIRRHGQDVLLTLTIDCACTDEELIQIANDLRPYGNLKLRINHECMGNWFTHNQRFSHKEVGAFFVRFARILKKNAPNVKTIFCAGYAGEDGKVDHEEDFLEAYKTADIWSADCYLALHHGWPFDIAEKNGGRWTVSSVEDYYKRFEKTWKRLTEITGQKKPLMTAEFNTDGDVVGAENCAKSVIAFEKIFKNHGAAEWFGGVSLYQFRDRGRLGLEMEDANCGIEQPLLAEYKKLIHEDYFKPHIVEEDDKLADYADCTGKLNWSFEWRGSENATGLQLNIPLEKKPVFFEMTVNQNIGLMIECNGTWFYKATHVQTVDLQRAFWKQPLAKEGVKVNIFAPPADGLNIQDGNPDWAECYRTTLVKMPEFRIRYEAVAEVGESLKMIDFPVKNNTN